MANCGTNKYTQDEFDGVIESILNNNYVDYITSRFDSETANALLRGISLDQTNPDLGTKDLDEIIEFLFNFDNHIESELDILKSSIPDYATIDDTVPLTSYADVVENGGVRGTYDLCVQHFRDTIVEKCILDRDGKLINPKDVNKNLYEYKLELFNKILNFLSSGLKISDFQSDAQFTKSVKSILASFESRIKNQDISKIEDAFEAYIQLKYFDHFISDEISFIAIKPEFVHSNTLGKEMYISNSPFNYKDRLASYSEEAGTEDYTSSFVKLLLNYFKADGKRIGFEGFQAVAGRLIEWVESTANNELQKALYLGIDESIDGKYGIVQLLEAFANEPSISANLKSLTRGILDNIFNSNLESKVKKIFLNQMITSVRYAYMAYRIKYDPDSKESGAYAMRFTSMLLQSDLVDRQTYNIQKIVKNRVYTLRHNPQLLKELIDKYDLVIDSGKIIINAHGKSQVTLFKDFPSESYTIQITKEMDADSTTIKRYLFGTLAQMDPSQISLDFLSSFLEDVTGLILPQDAENIFDVTNPSNSANSRGRMWNSFIVPALITLTASSKTSDGLQNLFPGYQYLYRNEELKLFNYFKNFQELGRFYSVVYGAESATVIKNAEGNNLPTHQLRTSVFDVKHYLYNIKNHRFTQRSNVRVYDNEAKQWKDVSLGKHVFGKNYLLYNGSEESNVIGTIAMRSDTRIDESHRVSQQLSPNEVIREAVEVDFFQNLFGTSALAKNRRDSGERMLTENSIWLQPIVFSDKRTHFIIEYRIDKLKLGKDRKTLSDILKNICSFNGNRKEDIALMESEIRKVRLDKYEKQVLNLIKRFSIALGWTDLIRTKDESVRSFFDRAKKKLHEFYIEQRGSDWDTLTKEQRNERKKQILSNLESYFGTSADLYNDSDISIATSGEIFFNPTLDKQLEVYSDQTKFETRIKQQKLNYIRDLIEIGYILDPNENPSLRSIFNVWKQKNPDWFDSIDGTMALFKAKDATGNTRLIDWTDLDNIDLNSFTFELNPILEGYFYADNFLSQQFNDVLFGDVNGYTAKHSDFKLENETTLLNDMFYTEDESSRLTDMAKRTVLAGASRITFAQGMKYGIGSHALIASIEDLNVPVFNFTGSKGNFKATDGSTLVHSVFARLQNYSLLDRRVGNQRKKTFANGIDPETGTAWELKHAEYTLTNEYRRIGCEHTDFSYEKLYEKLSSLKSDKFGKIDLSKYYGKEKHTNTEGENITCTEDIFRYNLDLCAYEKLTKIEQVGNKAIAHWQLYNENHTPVLGVEETTQDFILDSLYSLDQLFGGAYCSIWNADTNQFEFSEINQDLLTIIVCEEDLKNNFISLASNHSATKVGVKNINRGNVTKNNEPLKYWEFSTLSYGIQMNPDHDIEDTHGVREMSQMISALIQGGYMNNEVQEIYKMIGEVALDSVRTTIDAVDQENQEKIYEIVGQALLKAFDTNQKDVLGLAQSFIAMANRDLATGSFKTKIPFSANTIKGSFQATITSFLNKDAIRRRYSGMGGINTPSHGGIQYFVYNGQKLTWLEFVKAVGGKRTADLLLTDLSWNGNQFNNPTIVPISSNRLKLNDTIVYRDSLGPHVIKLDSPEELYEYKYYNNKGQLYLWTVKPKDFSGSEIVFEGIDGSAYSIYDTDLVRIIIESKNLVEHPEDYFYVDIENKIILDPKTKSPTLKLRGITYYNLLRNAFRDRVINVADLSNISFIEELFAEAKWKIQNDLLPQLSNAKNGGEINIQECMKPSVNNIEDWSYDDTKVKLKSASVNTIEAGIGKMSAKKLGLRKGDTINDVLSKGSDFFKNRIKNQIWKPAYVDTELYDAVLYDSEGKQTLVVVGSLNDNSDRMNHFQNNSDYKLRGNDYWKNDVNYGDSKGIVFKQHVDNAGNVYDVAIVDSWNTFDKLYHNGLYSNAVYNYTENNWREVVKYRNKFNFDKTGKLIASIGKTVDGKDVIVQGEDGDLYNNFNANYNDNTELLIWLNKDENRRQNNFISRKAKDMFDAFTLQLKLIIDRIPSQSMQSFTSADVVMLLDTEENTINFSAFLLWLQGADLDIDKSFTITYEIGEDGRVIVPTKLNRYFTATQCLELPLPNRKKISYYTADEYGEKVLSGEINDGGLEVKQQDFVNNDSLYNLVFNVLSGNGIVYYNSDVSDVNKNKLEWLIKLHQDSINLPSQIKTAGYKNKIVHIIHKVLRDPIVQIQLNVPVDDVMSELSSAIPTPKYKAELYRTWDNPIAKFRIQYDNMVGREVIGISAVSLKAFFAESAFGNLVIQNLSELIKSYAKTNDVSIGNKIVEQIKKICFAYKFKSDENISSGIATIANLNFKSLLPLLANVKQVKFNISIDEDKFKQTTDSPSVLKRYVLTNGELDLESLIKDLDLYSNGTYKKPKNAASVLSGYTSLATDNAKELKLVKMNATSKFADIHTFLATVGCYPKDVIEFMASPAFKLIARFAETSVFNSNTNRIKVENALRFVRDEACLPVIKDYMFHKMLCDTAIGGFIRTLDSNYIYEIASSVDLNLGRLDNDKEEYIRVINDAIQDKTTRLKIVSKIYEILRNNTNLINNLLNVIKDKVESTPSRYKHSSIVDEDMLLDQSFNEEDYFDVLDEDYQYDQQDYFKSWTLTKEDYIEGYKYVKYYLLPKNKALANFDSNVWQMYAKLENILDAIQEQRMLGILCGINQGMDTSDYDEYKNVIRVENYINKRYRKYMMEHENVKLEPFSFIKFLNDPEYRQKHIDFYNLCASTYNILDILTSVPHYNAMSKLIATNRYLIQRSVAIEMERNLAQQILLADKNEDGVNKTINDGYTQKFNEKEWSALRTYVSDLLILKWFEQQTDLKIGLPADIIVYSSGKPENNRKENIQGKVYAGVSEATLNRLDTLATFKRMMDTWIIPKLKKAFPNNAFLRDLTTGSIHNKRLNRLQVFYGPSFDLSQASKNSALDLRYKELSKAFNEISKQTLPKDMSKVLDVDGSKWKIGDLFFLYNLLVHKDGFGSQSLTRLFEDANTSSDKFVYNKQYYDYLSKLDSREIDYRKLFEMELTPTQGTQKNDHLIDLRIRLAFSSQANYKFRAESELEGDYTRVYILNSDGERREIDSWVNPDLNPSDYTLWFPWKLHKTGGINSVLPRTEKALKIERDTILSDNTFAASSKQIISTMAEHLSEILGPHVILTNNEELGNMWLSKSGPIVFSGEEDYLKTSNANAFIYNGNIYINTDKNFVDAPMHEFLHVLLAVMKYSGDDNMRRKYYLLLNEIVNMEDEEVNRRYEELKELYGKRRDSDIKEELLVEYIANRFASEFEKSYDKFVKDDKNYEVTKSDIEDFTKKALDEIFDTQIPKDLDSVTLGNTNIRTLISIFGNNVKNIGKNGIFTSILPQEIEIREIKAALFNNKQIDFNSACI